MTKILLSLCGSVCLLIFILMCSKESCPLTTPDVNTDPSFANEIQPIFTSSCDGSSCHISASSAGLNLSEGQAYTNIVNVNSSQVQNSKLVLPGDADKSYLVKKIEGGPGILGSKMPVEGELDAADITLIKNWINQGAKNN